MNSYKIRIFATLLLVAWGMWRERQIKKEITKAQRLLAIQEKYRRDWVNWGSVSGHYIFN